jgi:hypothetical protein
VATITLDRRERLNTIVPPMTDEFQDTGRNRLRRDRRRTDAPSSLVQTVLKELWSAPWT